MHKGVRFREKVNAMNGNLIILDNKGVDNEAMTNETIVSWNLSFYQHTLSHWVQAIVLWNVASHKNFHWVDKEQPTPLFAYSLKTVDTFLKDVRSGKEGGVWSLGRGENNIKNSTQAAWDFKQKWHSLFPRKVVSSCSLCLNFLPTHSLSLFLCHSVLMIFAWPCNSTPDTPNRRKKKRSTWNFKQSLQIASRVRVVHKILQVKETQRVKLYEHPILVSCTLIT